MKWASKLGEHIFFSVFTSEASEHQLSLYSLWIIMKRIIIAASINISVYFTNSIVSFCCCLYGFKWLKSKINIMWLKALHSCDIWQVQGVARLSKAQRQPMRQKRFWILAVDHKMHILFTPLWSYAPGTRLEWSQELIKAELEIICICQKKRYSSELNRLNPVLYSDIIRVVGHLENAMMPEEVKHPVIVANLHISDLIYAG